MCPGDCLYCVDYLLWRDNELVAVIDRQYNDLLNGFIAELQAEGEMGPISEYERGDYFGREKTKRLMERFERILNDNYEMDILVIHEPTDTWIRQKGLLGQRCNHGT